jgi:hypothetical protein
MIFFYDFLPRHEMIMDKLFFIFERYEWSMKLRNLFFILQENQQCISCNVKNLLKINRRT